MPSSKEKGSSHLKASTVPMEGMLFPQNESKSILTSKPQENGPNVKPEERVVLVHSWLLCMSSFVLTSMGIEE
jgi:hypothetical protein